MQVRGMMKEVICFINGSDHLFSPHVCQCRVHRRFRIGISCCNAPGWPLPSAYRSSIIRSVSDHTHQRNISFEAFPTSLVSAKSAFFTPRPLCQLSLQSIGIRSIPHRHPFGFLYVSWYFFPFGYKGYVIEPLPTSGSVVGNGVVRGCSLAYVSLTDPKGAIPLWAINKSTQYFAPKVRCIGVSCTTETSYGSTRPFHLAFAWQMIKTLHQACIGYAQWKSEHSPGYKPWIFPEQIDLPKLTIDQVISRWGETPYWLFSAVSNFRVTSWAKLLGWH